MRKSLNVIALTILMLAAGRQVSGQQANGSHLELMSSPPIAGTFYFVQRTNVPPFWFDPFGGQLSIYRIDGHRYLIDDSQVNYGEVAPQNGVMSAEGGGEMMLSSSFSPCQICPTNGSGSTNPSPTLPPAYFGLSNSTNLWLEIIWGSTNATILLHNTQSGVNYQLLGRAAIDYGAWSVVEDLVGAANTNTTVTTVPTGDAPTAFFIARATEDRDGDGLPDSYELLVTGTDPNDADTGDTGVPDGYKDSDGDGWTNLEEMQNGTDPTQFNTPLAPRNPSLRLISSGAEVSFTWDAPNGPVTGYVIRKGTNVVATVSSNALEYVDDYTDDVFDQSDVDDTYTVQAVYATGYSALSAAISLWKPELTIVSWLISGTNGQAILAVGGLSEKIDAVAVSWDGGGATWSHVMIPRTNFVNGLFVVPTGLFPVQGGSWRYTDLFAQGVNTSNELGIPVPVTGGFLLNGPEAFDSTYTHERWRFRPFLDMRAQLRDNLLFHLRYAALDGPIDYSFSAHHTTNYDYSGFHTFWGAGQFGLQHWYAQFDPLFPLHENYWYRNFVFSTNSFTSQGAWIPPNSSFDKSILTNSGFPTSRIPTNTSEFMFSDLSEISLTYSPDFSDVNVAVAANHRNCYGLLTVADLVVWQTNQLPTPPFYFDIITAGNSLWKPKSDWYLVFKKPEIPILQLIDYYFAEAEQFGAGFLQPVPGSESFSITNTTALIATAVGDPIHISGWAKKRITNGDTNKPAYLGQFFDKAYTADANGNATTNRTGILSEYGEFFPTEPGLAILKTKPDIDTGEIGEARVHVLKIGLDVNHDGDMDLSFGGPDNTSVQRPFVFWVNNDYDRWHYVHSDREEDDLASNDRAAKSPYSSGQPVPDSEYRNSLGHRVIPSERDLEDFARLWFAGITSNLVYSLPAGAIGELSWGDKGNPNTNNPTIDLFGPADFNGGIGYLTNVLQAIQQTNSINVHVGRLGPGDSITVVFSNSVTWNAWTRFIWCGVTKGSGSLTLTFRHGTNKIVETSARIDVKDIKEMYERWTVGDSPSMTPTNRPYLASEGIPSGSSRFQYAPPSDTNTPYILLVHDYDLPTWKKDRFAETAFKRLYWHGYQGRFGLFRWPGVDRESSRQMYHSESNAWASATGLLNLLTNLNAQYPGKVHLMAHGHGTIAAGEALRLAGANTFVNTYIAMQGAVPSHAYDPSAPLRLLGSSDSGTPNRYGFYPTNAGPPYFWGAGGVANYINYFNTNDYVLTNLWRSAQDLKPVLFSHRWDGMNFYRGYVPGLLLVFPVDRYEIFSYAAEARCEAIGAQSGLGGPFLILKEIDLAASYGFTSKRKDHSWQFLSDCAFQWDFWEQVLKSLGLK